MGEKFSKLAWLKSLAGADLTDGEYRVLVAIFNHTDEAGRRCYAKQTTLAQETGKSDRQIRRIIPELVRKGWVAEVRKGAGRSGLSSEFDLSTPEYRTPMTGISDQTPEEIPDTHDRYSVGIPDISGMNTGHLGHEYRTPVTGIPDTHVLPSDPYQIRPSEPDQIRGPVAPSDPLAEASIATGDDRQREPVTEVSSDLGASAGRYTGAEEAPGDRPESETDSVSSSVLAVADRERSEAASRPESVTTTAWNALRSRQSEIPGWDLPEVSTELTEEEIRELMDEASEADAEPVWLTTAGGQRLGTQAAADPWGSPW